MTAAIVGDSYRSVSTVRHTIVTDHDNVDFYLLFYSHVHR